MNVGKNLFNNRKRIRMFKKSLNSLKRLGYYIISVAGNIRSPVSIHLLGTLYFFDKCSINVYLPYPLDKFEKNNVFVVLRFFLN